MNRVSRGEAADTLREQAASCRRLARRARTPQGSVALAAVADQFDDDARRIDPISVSYLNARDALAAAKRGTRP